MKKQKRTFTCYTTDTDIDDLFFCGEPYDGVVEVGFHDGRLDAKKSQLEGYKNIKKFKVTVELMDSK